MLTSSPKIWHFNNRDFFQINSLGSDHWIWKSCCDTDFNSACVRVPRCLSKGRLKWDFLDIYLTRFSESLNSEIQNLWRSFCVLKYLQFKLDFKNAVKNWGKVLCFWENYIWIGIVKFSLLRTWYSSTAANVLTSSPKILYVDKRDFFQLNLFSSDRWIW